jgi:alkylation response protein AidB-like acyl-CoA dehydrogenase
VDFNLDEEHKELRDLAADLLGREAAQERLEAHERSGLPYDPALWRAMATAGLLGACLPEEAGGAGLGPLGMAVLCRETGAQVAPVPVEQSLTAALTVARCGTDEQRRALAPLADGEIVLAAAMRGPGAALTDPPDVVAEPGAGGRRLAGRTGPVPYAAQAARVLVPARTDAGVGLFLVEPGPGDLRPLPSGTGEPVAALVLDGAPGDPVGDPGAGGAAAGGGETAVATLRRYTLAAVTSTVSGVLAGALRLTTEHIRTRRQFDRALAEFQAVTMQIADVYVAARALDVAVWSGAWRLAEDLPADEDLAIAAYHATDAARTALYTCQHLHGGLGLDVTYPLHRYFAWGKHAAERLGGVDAQLDMIGALV